MTPFIGGDLLTLAKLTIAGSVLWVLPWMRPAAWLFPEISGAGRLSVAFLLGVVVNVLSSYFLALSGLYSPFTGLVHLILAAVVWVIAQRVSTGRILSWNPGQWNWFLLAAILCALLLRLPDSLRHSSLGGNDPWGHLVLTKALAKGDMIAGFHFFSYYPRGYHFLVLTWGRLSGVSPYEIMRLAAPLVSIIALLGTYALVRRASSHFGGLVAAFVYAVPPYRHLVLPALQTTLEPDRFSFALFPALLLLVNAILERETTWRAALLLVAGFVLFFIHPLSMQFLFVWVVLAAAAALRAKRAWSSISAVLGPAILVPLSGLVYYRIMHKAYGLTIMGHISPASKLDIGGYGLDLRRLLLGTGWYAQPMDLAALLILVFLGIMAWRQRNLVSLLLSFLLLHILYASLRDALYIGDFGHVPPYYAMAFAWATGSLLGQPAFSRVRWGLPLGLFLALLARWIFFGYALDLAAMVLAAAVGLFAATELVLPRLRGNFGPLAVGLAFLALRPMPVTYARLGYPEAVEWALSLPPQPRGIVYSLGLISKLPDGTPFPTQDPVKAIVWPDHVGAPFSSLLALPPDHCWPENHPVYLFMETKPYRWSFPYFAKEERDAILTRTRSWLRTRRAMGAPVREAASTDRMELLELHSREDRCSDSRS